MPSNRIADEIRHSLAEGEKFEDFAYMFDTLMALRAPYHQGKKQELLENIVGRIICIYYPDKPMGYAKAMQQFRLGFAGVAASPPLQKDFSDSITDAAIKVSRVEDIVWEPNRYFRGVRRTTQV